MKSAFAEGYIKGLKATSEYNGWNQDEFIRTGDWSARFTSIMADIKKSSDEYWQESNPTFKQGAGAFLEYFDMRVFESHMSDVEELLSDTLWRKNMFLDFLDKEKAGEDLSDYSGYMLFDDRKEVEQKYYQLTSVNTQLETVIADILILLEKDKAVKEQIKALNDGIQKLYNVTSNRDTAMSTLDNVI